MDNAVALVQAFLRLHGYLTVTEFPVVRRARHGGHECLTDLDVLGFRFGSARSSNEATAEDSVRLLGVSAGTADMLIGEVKEGRAELNTAATQHDVLAAALERFGCCSHADTDRLATELLRQGRTTTRHGHAVRLVAFGSLPPGHGDQRCHVVLLGDIVAELRDYVRAHWEVLRASASKDPGLGMLLTLEKASRGAKSAGIHGPTHAVRPPHPESQ